MSNYLTIYCNNFALLLTQINLEGIGKNCLEKKKSRSPECISLKCNLKKRELYFANSQIFKNR